MALRLRRGTDAQRQLITPVEGELIYVTDTKELYAGDGTTLGGVRISGEVVDTLNQLDDVDAALPQDGDVLIYDNATGDWVAGELPLVDLPDVNADGISDGQILAWDSASSAFIPANNIGGGGTTFVGELKGSVFGDDSRLLVDGVNSTIPGDAISGTITADLEGDVTGTLTGYQVGDMSGSVFGEDSTPVIDGIRGFVVGPVYNDIIETNNILAGKIRIGGDFPTQISVTDPDELTLFLNTTNTGGEVASGRPFRIGGTASSFPDAFLSLYTTDDTGISTARIIQASNSAEASSWTTIKQRGTKSVPTIVQIGDSLGTHNSLGFNGATYEGGSGIRYVVSDTPAVNNIPSDIELYHYNSAGGKTPALTVKYSQQTTEFAGPAKVVNYANDTARDAAITSPEAGMIIFNQRDDSTGVPQFQGYDGSVWVDLH